MGLLDMDTLCDQTRLWADSSKRFLHLPLRQFFYPSHSAQELLLSGLQLPIKRNHRKNIRLCLVLLLNIVQFCFLLMGKLEITSEKQCGLKVSHLWSCTVYHHTAHVLSSVHLSTQTHVERWLCVRDGSRGWTSR